MKTLKLIGNVPKLNETHYTYSHYSNTTNMHSHVYMNTQYNVAIEHVQAF